MCTIGIIPFSAHVKKKHVYAVLLEVLRRMVKVRQLNHLTKR